MPSHRADSLPWNNDDDDYYDKLKKDAPTPDPILSWLFYSLPNKLNSWFGSGRRDHVSRPQHARTIPRTARRDIVRYLWRNIFSLTTALIIVWVCLLYWGEIWLFDTTIRECQWSNWERWVFISIHGICLLVEQKS